MHPRSNDDASYRLCIKNSYIKIFSMGKMAMFDEYSLRFLSHDNDVYVIVIWLRDVIVKGFIWEI